MKKFLAAVLAFAMIFALAACKNNVDENQTTEPVAEETGRPGDWVTNASGELQTTANYYVILDDNSKPMTEIVTDENGSESVQVVTTVVYDIETYPGATQAPTVAPGYTMADKNMSWPAHKFIEKVPVLAEKISDSSYSKTEDGEAAVIYLNDMSYEDYLKYIDKCRAAGFEQTYGNNLPEKEEDGESYIYYSIANGLYLGVTYNTHSAPYRNCDVKITVANYDVAGINSEDSGINSKKKLCEVSGCNKEGTKKYVNNLTDQTEYYCDTHYNEIINMLNNMAEDIGNGK